MSGVGWVLVCVKGKGGGKGRRGEDGDDKGKAGREKGVRTQSDINTAEPP